jgi:hypothetical protein
MKVIFMQKVAVVSEWKFARAVSVGVLLSITHNGQVYEPVKIKRIKRRNDEKSTKKENKRLEDATKYKIRR